MKKNFKWLLPVVVLSLITACNKNEDDVLPVPPSEKNKTVFASDNGGNFFAANALTGAKMWNFVTGNTDDFHFGSPAVNKDVSVFTDAENGKVYCISNNTGNIIWSKDGLSMPYWEIGSPLASPILVNNVVYISTEAKILGFNQADGSLAKEIIIPVNDWINSINYYKGTFIVGTCYNHLFGINPDAGTQWEYNSDAGGCFHGNPTVVEGVIYIKNYQGELSAINVNTGTKVWSRMTNITGTSTVIYSKGLLLITGGEITTDKMFAFDAVNGDLKHTYNMPSGHTTYPYVAPAINNNILYVFSPEGSLIAFNVDGENILWQKDFSALGGRRAPEQITHNGRTQIFNFSSSVVIANDMIFFNADKILIGTDMNGNMKWQMTADNFINSSPVILSDKDKVYRPNTAGVVVL